MLRVVRKGARAKAHELPLHTRICGRLIGAPLACGALSGLASFAVGASIRKCEGRHDSAAAQRLPAPRLLRKPRVVFDPRALVAALHTGAGWSRGRGT